MRLSPKQREALTLIAQSRFYPTFVKEEDGWHARWRAIGSENGWVDEFVRSSAVTRLTEDAEDQRHETLHDAWLMALKSVTGLVRWEEHACEEFAAELRTWSGDVEEDAGVRREVAFDFEIHGRRFFLACAVPKGRRRLKALGQATYVYGPLRGLAPDATGRRLICELSHAEAERFVQTHARELSDAGYTVRGVDLSATVTADAVVKAGDGPGRPADVKLVVRVAGEQVSAEELRFLLDQNSSFVFFRDRWIEVDRGILREALRALERGGGRPVHPLSFALGLGHIGRLELEEVRAHGWLRGLVNELKAAGNGTLELPRVVPDGFRGTLRDYQRRGVEWLSFLTDHGFGALLADDMGLGKTVQVIAWILAAKVRPVLVVAPLTLLGNWRHELAAFAPSLRVYVHQGEGRHLASGFRAAAGRADVVLTSYNLLVKDARVFADVAWGALVLDEAQVIKNPDTQAAAVVRALTPARRIAITGTPVENSVGDLWSLEEFLNPGFLGERKSFEERFVRPIALDSRSAAGARLRRALEPFVLRRLKSDPAIAATLGEKHELREYCVLDAESRRAYEDALADFRARESSPGEVFALLTELKQICDGPGKLERLMDLLDGIFAAGESALVFTQYVKVGEWLKQELERRFARKFPFLHGAQDAAVREREIAAFNRGGPKAFILSLRAGGFGLNLVKASHVIHFDRWWNPAVENQATDRAHRIGQTRTVFVHLFITEGTLEEHVDEMLARKAEIAETVITAAEWLEAARLDGQT